MDIDIKVSYSAPGILNRFCVAGINYHKANAKVRGLFAVNNMLHRLILDEAKRHNIRSVFVLSTCNRTEIYGYVEDVSVLVDLLTAHTEGGKTEFLEHAFLKTGDEALMHLFSVAGGLDSQILGDNEIQGQLKRAIEFARMHDAIGPIMDRTLNFVLQASKKIRSATAISSGTVSVSYAAIELLRDIQDILQKKILLVGAGKIGENVCRNLKTYLDVKSVTVVNRTMETAQKLADSLQVQHLPYEKLPIAADDADVIILCTNAPHPTIHPHYFESGKGKWILDLSIPMNVHPRVKELSNIKVIDVDEISTAILDKTLSKRKAEVPKAMAIIQEHRDKFWQWLLSYQDSLQIRIWKYKLEKLIELYPVDAEPGDKDAFSKELIQKTVKRLAGDLRRGNTGCMVIQAVNDHLNRIRNTELLAVKE